jgi:hypothetical protein
MVARFIRRLFGRYVDRSEGYSLRVTYNNFPGMNIRYVEGPRTMNVFGEIMANLKDLHLDLTTFGHWEMPHDSEVLDEARRTVVLDRMVAALGHLGYAVRLWEPETRNWKPRS